LSEVPQGYKSLTGVSPAEDHIGPFYYKKSDTGLKLGFHAVPHNCNGIGTVHGGVLMAFADYVVTMLALSGVKENCTTISFSSDFIAAARLGDWVEGEGEVVKRTGSMTFVHGRLRVGEDSILGFQAVVRRLKKPSP
jgi:uncharacterized protein (TIGR00369 family)